MIPQETIGKVLDAVRIEEVIGDFVTLRRRGASLVACCPFHSEKTPSFHVTPSRGIYKCFGCQKGGSAVSFVMEYEHCTYPEAIRYLANKYHIEIEEREESAEEIAQRQHRESLHLVMDFAQQFFVDNLKKDEGRAVAYAYYRSRGMSDETIERFGLGWSPSKRNALATAALAAGFKEEYLVEAGLCYKTETGELIDHFHDRVTFPIHSVSGRIVAYSCRLLHESQYAGKYKNSPETEIYVKSRSLFGIFLAKSEISRKDKCYLVEGNVDVVSMHQLGITNLVASCGTALTPDQVRLIKRFTSNVTIMYDGDSAGIKAAVKAVKLFLAEDMDVRVVLLPDGDDPDSFSRKHTLDEVEQFIAEHEKDFISFNADLLSAEAQRDPIKRSAFISEIADTIALIPDEVKRNVYSEALAQRFAMDSQIIFRHVKTTRIRLSEEAAQELERQRRREQASLPPEPEVTEAEAQQPQYPQPAQISPMACLEEDKVLSQTEMDLMYFILNHGTDVLDFPSDSDYYSGSEADKPLVADFIRASLESDGSSFSNSGCRITYDAYMALYDEGFEQDDMLKRLLNSPDPVVSFVTAEIAINKYELTVKELAGSMTAVPSWLVRQVPKTIMCYAERRIEKKELELLEQMKAAASDMDRQMALLEELGKIKQAHKRVLVKLGRDKSE